MVITEIVSQHAEEAAFLWLLRSNATHAPHYSLKDLASWMAVWGLIWMVCVCAKEYLKRGQVLQSYIDWTKSLGCRGHCVSSFLWRRMKQKSRESFLMPRTTVRSEVKLGVHG